MHRDNILTPNKFHFLFSLTWIFSLLFYPIWIEPTTVQIRFSIYMIITIWTIINIILLYRFLLNNPVQKVPSNFFNMQLDKHLITLIVLLLINVMLHIYPISFPLIIGGDEATHAHGGVGLISRFLWMNGLDPDKYFGFIKICVWALILLLLIVMFILKKNRAILKRVFSITNSKSYILFFAILFFISTILFIFTRNIEYHMALMRYPPIDKMLYGISVLLFGINEFSVRIPQLLFAIFGSILLFKICEENLNSTKIGLIAASFYVFSPIVFHYSALAEVACGTVFFSILIIYFYLKYVKTGNEGFLVQAFYFLSLGFLYKRIIILMLAVLIISILLLREKKVSLPFILKLSYFCLVPIIPYIVIGKIYPNNPFGINLLNWFEPHAVFGYFILLLRQLSYPLSLLVVISTIYILFTKDIFKPSVFVFFVLFILYYVFYTSGHWHGSGSYIYGVNRYSMIFYPFISISIGLFVDRIIRSIKWRYSFELIFFVLIIFLFSISTIWQVPPLNANYVTYKNIESRYFPCDKAMLWVKDNVKDGEKILIIRVTPAAFYRDKYGIDREKIIEGSLRDYSSTYELLAYCRANKITYLMLSNGPADKANMKWETIKYLKDDNAVNEEADFKLDGNHIYVFKILTTIQPQMNADRFKYKQTQRCP